MAKTGINFKRCNCRSAEAHNERSREYLEALERSGKKKYAIFSDRTEENTHWINPEYAGKTLEQVLEDCRKRYETFTHQKPQEEDRVRVITDKKTGLQKTVTTAGWSPIREGVCPVKDDTTTDDFKPFVEYLESKGIHVIRIDIHRDEGYEDPVTRERKYNLHAHIVIDWTDHTTGKTIKLNKDDMSEIQTVLAEALGMERGEAKGVDGPDHLSVEQFREKKAREHANKIEKDIKELKQKEDLIRKSIKEAQELESVAVEKAAAAEKAASREQLRSNAADVGARILGFFGQGAIAEAETDREAAEKEAAEARAAEEAAKKAKMEAEAARDEAIRAKRTAEEHKEEYGRKRYREGKIAGYDEGKEAAAVEISKLKKQMADKTVLLQKEANEKIEKAQAEKSEMRNQLMQANERAKSFEEEIKAVKTLIPNLQNWRKNLTEMKKAGVKREDAVEVLRYGYKRDAEVSFTYNAKMHKCTANVSLARDKSGHMSVWFDGVEPKAFVQKVIQKNGYAGPKL